MPRKTIQKVSRQVRPLLPEEAEELGKCYQSPEYFIQNYCYIYDAAAGHWMQFKLWDAQVESLNILHNNQLTVILKARQLGMTWLCLAYALWTVIFRPIASVLLFSRRDADAMYLLSEDRLKGMYNRLPDWMKSGLESLSDNAHEWVLSNDSAVRAFPTTAGDSYTASLAVVDEADLSPDLNSLLRAVKPTIDNGGKMILLSRADKDKPISDFKRIYEGGKAGRNPWKSIFLPWYVHPKRSEIWYQAQKDDIQLRTGSLDDLYEQYPATDQEALKPRATDKRIPFEWIQDVYQEEMGDDSLGIPGLFVFRRPVKNHPYVIGADPAEGNPNSDASAAVVMDAISGEEVALLSGKIQPSQFTDYLIRLGNWYNEAGILVERNNHGHAVILKLAESGYIEILNGFDDKFGWFNTAKGKSLLYNTLADAIREKECVIHSFDAYSQLVSIVGSTLKAPENMHDDAATAFGLAVCAKVIIQLGNVTIKSLPVQSVVSSVGQVSAGQGIGRKIEFVNRPRFSRTMRITRTATRGNNINESVL